MTQTVSSKQLSLRSTLTVLIATFMAMFIVFQGTPSANAAQTIYLDKPIAPHGWYSGPYNSALLGVRGWTDGSLNENRVRSLRQNSSVYASASMVGVAATLRHPAIQGYPGCGFVPPSGSGYSNAICQYYH